MFKAQCKSEKLYQLSNTQYLLLLSAGNYVHKIFNSRLISDCVGLVCNMIDVVGRINVNAKANLTSMLAVSQQNSKLKFDDWYDKSQDFTRSNFSYI